MSVCYLCLGMGWQMSLSSADHNSGVMWSYKCRPYRNEWLVLIRQAMVRRCMRARARACVCVYVCLSVVAVQVWLVGAMGLLLISGWVFVPFRQNGDTGVFQQPPRRLHTSVPSAQFQMNERRSQAADASGSLKSTPKAATRCVRGWDVWARTGVCPRWLTCAWMCLCGIGAAASHVSSPMQPRIHDRTANVLGQSFGRTASRRTS